MSDIKVITPSELEQIVNDRFFSSEPRFAELYIGEKEYDWQNVFAIFYETEDVARKAACADIKSDIDHGFKPEFCALADNPESVTAFILNASDNFKYWAIGKNGVVNMNGVYWVEWTARNDTNMTIYEIKEA